MKINILFAVLLTYATFSYTSNFPRQSEYESMCAQMFNIPQSEVKATFASNLFAAPRLYPESNPKLNIAAQAHNTGELSRMLNGQSQWHEDTLKEALSLLNSPYFICSFFKPVGDRSETIRLLEAKMANLSE